MDLLRPAGSDAARSGLCMEMTEDFVHLGGVKSTCLTARPERPVQSAECNGWPTNLLRQPVLQALLSKCVLRDATPPFSINTC